MALTKEPTIEYLRENGLIIFEATSGSHAYGTNNENSDVDIRGVFVAPQEMMYGLGYVDQVGDKTNDVVFYELGRFLKLLYDNNPNILELLNVPEDCIIYKSPLFDIILEHKDEFITKKCGMSFGGYAASQIKKAQGLNKKQNWEKDKVTRKNPFDFCYVLGYKRKRYSAFKRLLYDKVAFLRPKMYYNGYKLIQDASSVPLEIFLETLGMDKLFCGVSAIAHARGMHALYYDWTAHKCFSPRIASEKREKLKRTLTYKGKPLGIGYHGLVKENDEDSKVSNQLRMSSIPEGEKVVCYFYYNESGYTRHCEDFKSYQKWLSERNEARYVETKNHGQMIDGKNLMHCMRLLSMAEEIASGKGIIVRRPDADRLLSIRRGEVGLSELLNMAENKIKEVDALFTKVNLPEEVSSELIHNLAVKVRTMFYETKK